MRTSPYRVPTNMNNSTSSNNSRNSSLEVVAETMVVPSMDTSYRSSSSLSTYAGVPTYQQQQQQQQQLQNNMNLSSTSKKNRDTTVVVDHVDMEEQQQQMPYNQAPRIPKHPTLKMKNLLDNSYSSSSGSIISGTTTGGLWNSQWNGNTSNSSRGGNSTGPSSLQVDPDQNDSCVTGLDNHQNHDSFYDSPEQQHRYPDNSLSSLDQPTTTIISSDEGSLKGQHPTSVVTGPSRLPSRILSFWSNQQVTNNSNQNIDNDNTTTTTKKNSSVDENVSSTTKGLSGSPTNTSLNSSASTTTKSSVTRTPVITVPMAVGGGLRKDNRGLSVGSSTSERILKVQSPFLASSSSTTTTTTLSTNTNGIATSVPKVTIRRNDRQWIKEEATSPSSAIDPEGEKKVNTSSSSSFYVGNRSNHTKTSSSSSSLNSSPVIESTSMVLCASSFSSKSEESSRSYQTTTTGIRRYTMGDHSEPEGNDGHHDQPGSVLEVEPTNLPPKSPDPRLVKKSDTGSAMKSIHKRIAELALSDPSTVLVHPPKVLLSTPPPTASTTTTTTAATISNTAVVVDDHDDEIIMDTSTSSHTTNSFTTPPPVPMKNNSNKHASTSNRTTMVPTYPSTPPALLYKKRSPSIITNSKISATNTTTSSTNSTMSTTTTTTVNSPPTVEQQLLMSSSHYSYSPPAAEVSSPSSPLDLIHNNENSISSSTMMESPILTTPSWKTNLPTPPTTNTINSTTITNTTTSPSAVISTTANPIPISEAKNKNELSTSSSSFISSESKLSSSSLSSSSSSKKVTKSYNNVSTSFLGTSNSDLQRTGGEDGTPLKLSQLNKKLFPDEDDNEIPSTKDSNQHDKTNVQQPPAQPLPSSSPPNLIRRKFFPGINLSSPLRSVPLPSPASSIHSQYHNKEEKDDKINMNGGHSSSGDDVSRDTKLTYHSARTTQEQQPEQQPPEHLSSASVVSVSSGASSSVSVHSMAPMQPLQRKAYEKMAAAAAAAATAQSTSSSTGGSSIKKGNNVKDNLNNSSDHDSKNSTITTTMTASRNKSNDMNNNNTSNNNTTLESISPTVVNSDRPMVAMTSSMNPPLPALMQMQQQTPTQTRCSFANPRNDVSHLTIMDFDPDGKIVFDSPYRDHRLSDPYNYHQQHQQQYQNHNNVSYVSGTQPPLSEYESSFPTNENSQPTASPYHQHDHDQFHLPKHLVPILRSDPMRSLPPPPPPPLPPLLPPHLSGQPNMYYHHQPQRHLGVTGVETTDAFLMNAPSYVDDYGKPIDDEIPYLLDPPSNDTNGDNVAHQNRNSGENMSSARTLVPVDADGQHTSFHSIVANNQHPGSANNSFTAVNNSDPTAMKKRNLLQSLQKPPDDFDPINITSICSDDFSHSHEHHVIVNNSHEYEYDDDGRVLNNSNESFLPILDDSNKSHNNQHATGRLPHPGQVLTPSSPPTVRKVFDLDECIGKDISHSHSRVLSGSSHHSTTPSSRGPYAPTPQPHPHFDGTEVDDILGPSDHYPRHVHQQQLQQPPQPPPPLLVPPSYAVGNSRHSNEYSEYDRVAAAAVARMMLDVHNHTTPLPTNAAMNESSSSHSTNNLPINSSVPRMPVGLPRSKQVSDHTTSGNISGTGIMDVSYDTCMGTEDLNLSHDSERVLRLVLSAANEAVQKEDEGITRRYSQSASTAGTRSYNNMELEAEEHHPYYPQRKPREDRSHLSPVSSPRSAAVERDGPTPQRKNLERKNFANQTSNREYMNAKTEEEEDEDYDSINESYFEPQNDEESNTMNSKQRESETLKSRGWKGKRPEKNSSAPGKNSKKYRKQEKKGLKRTTSRSYDNEYDDDSAVDSKEEEEEEEEGLERFLLGAFLDLIIPPEDDEGSILSADSDSTSSLSKNYRSRLSKKSPNGGRHRRSHSVDSSNQQQHRRKEKKLNKSRESRSSNHGGGRRLSSLDIIKEWWKKESTAAVMKDPAINLKPEDDDDEPSMTHLPNIEEVINAELQRVFSGEGGVSFWGLNTSRDNSEKVKDKSMELERYQDELISAMTDKTPEVSDEKEGDRTIADWLTSWSRAVEDVQQCGVPAQGLSLEDSYRGLQKRVGSFDSSLSKTVELKASLLAKDFKHMLPHLRNRMGTLGGRNEYASHDMSSTTSPVEPRSERTKSEDETEFSSTRFTGVSERRVVDLESKLLSVVEGSSEQLGGAAERERDSDLLKAFSILQNHENGHPDDSLDAFLANDNDDPSLCHIDPVDTQSCKDTLENIDSFESHSVGDGSRTRNKGSVDVSSSGSHQQKESFDDNDNETAESKSHDSNSEESNSSSGYGSDENNSQDRVDHPSDLDDIPVQKKNSSIDNDENPTTLSYPSLRDELTSIPPIRRISSPARELHAAYGTSTEESKLSNAIMSSSTHNEPRQRTRKSIIHIETNNMKFSEIVRHPISPTQNNLQDLRTDSNESDWIENNEKSHEEDLYARRDCEPLYEDRQDEDEMIIQEQLTEIELMDDSKILGESYDGQGQSNVSETEGAANSSSSLLVDADSELKDQVAGSKSSHKLRGSSDTDETDPNVITSTTWEDVGHSVFKEWKRKRNSVSALKKIGKLRFLRNRSKTGSDYGLGSDSGVGSSSKEYEDPPIDVSLLLANPTSCTEEAGGLTQIGGSSSNGSHESAENREASNEESRQQSLTMHDGNDESRSTSNLRERHVDETEKNVDEFDIVERKVSTTLMKGPSSTRKSFIHSRRLRRRGDDNNKNHHQFSVSANNTSTSSEVDTDFGFDAKFGKRDNYTTPTMGERHHLVDARGVVDNKLVGTTASSSFLPSDDSLFASATSASIFGGVEDNSEWEEFSTTIAFTTTKKDTTRMTTTNMEQFLGGDLTTSFDNNEDPVLVSVFESFIPSEESLLLPNQALI